MCLKLLARKVQMSMSTMKIKNNIKFFDAAGFTLIELIVVLSVIAVLVSLTVPVINSWVPTYQIKGAARGLYTNFQAARSQALKRNANVVIKFSTVTYPATGGSYKAFVDNGAGGGTANNVVQDGGEETIFEASMPETCSLVSASFGGTLTGYNARGLPLGNRVGAAIVRNNKSAWYKLSLSNSGYPKIQASDTGVDGSWE